MSEAAADTPTQPVEEKKEETPKEEEKMDTEAAAQAQPDKEADKSVS